MNTPVKKILTSFLLFVTLTAGAEVQISIQPPQVVAGEPAVISIKSTEGQPEIKNLPDVPGLTWLDKNTINTSTMVLNGTAYLISSYTFQVDRPGIIKIPSMTISIGSDTRKTQEKELRVTQGIMSEIDNYVLLKPVYKIYDDKKPVYTGEDIPLEIYFLQADGFNINPTEYPQIKMDNVVFDDFSKVNTDNQRFARYPYYNPENTSENGISFIKTCFYTSFRPVSPGKLQGSVSLLVEITVPDKSDNSSAFNNFFGNSSLFNDPFFNRSKHVSKLLTAKLPELEVSPLPEIPQNTKFLGLIGEWRLTAHQLPAKASEGDPMTLSLEVNGSGSLETLKAPELSIPGFTVYPPEISRSDSSGNDAAQLGTTKINYVMVPVEKGIHPINLSFATFNTIKGAYETVSVNTAVDVAEGNRKANGAVFDNNQVSGSSAASQALLNKPAKKMSNDILYLKTKGDGTIVSMPIWRNRLLPSLALIILSPLVLLLVELLKYRNETINKDSSARRRYDARKHRGAVLKAMKKAPEEELGNVVHSQVIPYIVDLKGLPPGSTAEEIAAVLGEQAECLKAAGISKYMPGGNVDSRELKKKVISLISKLSVVVFMCLLAINGSAAAQQADYNPFEKLSSEYNAGKFRNAKNVCVNYLSQNPSSPNWLYNLGNCCYEMGDLPRAMLYFNRALLIAPRDSDILENLNYVRNKLLLPELYRTSSPSELVVYIRDIFRPDEWMLIFSLAWCSIFVILIFRRTAGTKITVTVICAAAAICILAAGAAGDQMLTIYSSDNAIVLQKNPTVYSLPSQNSQPANMDLAAGEQVRIMETNGSWSRIRTAGNNEGWVPNNLVEQLWPNN